jgi:hypothetical protein
VQVSDTNIRKKVAVVWEKTLTGPQAGMVDTNLVSLALGYR